MNIRQEHNCLSLSLSLFKSSTHGVHNIPSYENFWILHRKMSVPATAYYKFGCLCRRHRNERERRQSDWNEARKRQQQLGQIVQWCHFGSLTFSLSPLSPLLSLSLIGRKRQSFLPFPSSIVIASLFFFFFSMGFCSFCCVSPRISLFPFLLRLYEFSCRWCQCWEK